MVGYMTVVNGYGIDIYYYNKNDLMVENELNFNKYILNTSINIQSG